MDVLAFGRQLLILGTCLTGMIFVLSLAGILRKDRRFVTSARVGLYALFMVVGGSALSLVYGFVAGIYDCTYVYDYSEKLLPLSYKIAGLWGGLNGSLLFWTFLVRSSQRWWGSSTGTARATPPAGDWSRTSTSS